MSAPKPPTPKVDTAIRPKREFLQSGAARGHRDLVLNASFRMACEKALLQVLFAQPSTNKIEEASANWQRVDGAIFFMQSLLTIGEETQPPPTKTDYNLPGNK